MRHGLVLAAIGAFAATAGADPIRYDQIPADVMSYAHVDAEHLLASRLSQIEMNGYGSIRDNLGAGQVSHWVWGSMTSATLYTVGDEGNPVVLIHAPADEFQHQVEERNSTETVSFEYDHQEVHYSSSCLLPSIFGDNDDKAAGNAEEQPHLYLGLGSGNSRFRGAFYTAYVGPDLIVTALDLPAMAEALDVINGRKPSLAKEDPHHLKMDAPAGVILLGAGLSADWAGGNLSPTGDGAKGPAGSTTRPATASHPDFGMDLFASFRGKARIARFDVGEKEQDDYADATFGMTDADSASQLKNLLIGMKSLVSLSQPDAKPLMEAVTIDTSANDVVLHWAMPTSDVAALVRAAAGSSESSAHERSTSANLANGQPTR